VNHVICHSQGPIVEEERAVQEEQSTEPLTTSYGADESRDKGHDRSLSAAAALARSRSIEAC
jgi:hypothetical protein